MGNIPNQRNLAFQPSSYKQDNIWQMYYKYDKPSMHFKLTHFSGGMHIMNCPQCLGPWTSWKEPFKIISFISFNLISKKETMPFAFFQIFNI